jgi:hypothetical protein
MIYTPTYKEILVNGRKVKIYTPVIETWIQRGESKRKLTEEPEEAKIEHARAYKTIRCKCGAKTVRECRMCFKCERKESDTYKLHDITWVHIAPFMGAHKNEDFWNMKYEILAIDSKLNVVERVELDNKYYAFLMARQIRIMYSAKNLI